MPRTHFYNSYAAVVAMERFMKRYSITDTSQIAEQGIRMLTDTDKKLDGLLASVDNDVSKLDPNLPLLTVKDFCKILEESKKPLETHARYAPGITEYVTYPDVKEPSGTPLVSITRDIDQVAEEAKKLDVQRLHEGVANSDAVEERAKAAMNAAQG